MKKLSQIAKEIGIEKGTIRFYANLGLIELTNPSPGRGTSRLVDNESVARFKLAFKMIDGGIGIESVKLIVKNYGSSVDRLKSASIKAVEMMKKINTGNIY